LHQPGGLVPAELNRIVSIFLTTPLKKLSLCQDIYFTIWRECKSSFSAYNFRCWFKGLDNKLPRDARTFLSQLANQLAVASFKETYFNIQKSFYISFAL